MLADGSRMHMRGLDLDRFSPSLLYTMIEVDPRPVIVTERDNSNCTRVPIFLIHHYYRVGGPPKP